jgi:hypothetical protein
MAIAKQVPNVIVTLIGNWEILFDVGPFHFKPGKFIILAHKPISTIDLIAKDAQKLSESTFIAIQNRLREAGY